MKRWKTVCTSVRGWLILVQKELLVWFLGYGAGGFTPMGVETVAKTRTYPDGKPLEEAKKDPRVRSDLVESLIFHKSEKDVVPEFPNFLPSIYQYEICLEKYSHRRVWFIGDEFSYWDEVLSLLTTLMEITAVSLRLDRHHFVESFKQPSCVLRLAYYPPQQEIPPVLFCLTPIQYSDHLGRSTEVRWTHRLHWIYNFENIWRLWANWFTD